MSCLVLPKAFCTGVFLCKFKLSNGVTGVRWSSYGENPHLREFFKVLSLSADRDERIYISTIEAHKVMLITLLHQCYCHHRCHRHYENSHISYQCKAEISLM